MRIAFAPNAELAKQRCAWRSAGMRIEREHFLLPEAVTIHGF
jgi:hypothetical protein